MGSGWIGRSVHSVILLLASNAWMGTRCKCVCLFSIKYSQILLTHWLMQNDIFNSILKPVMHADVTCAGWEASFALLRGHSYFNIKGFKSKWTWRSMAMNKWLIKKSHCSVLCMPPAVHKKSPQRHSSLLWLTALFNAAILKISNLMQFKFGRID